MNTVHSTVYRLVARSPLLEEYLQNRLINLSAYARFYQKEIERMLQKPVHSGAIVMALKRITTTIGRSERARKIFAAPPEIIIRSHLFELTVKGDIPVRLTGLLAEPKSNRNNYFLTITAGLFESTIIGSIGLQKIITSAIPRETILSSIDHLSSITVRLPKNNVTTPGVYYLMLKQLAWENINIFEVVSSANEVSIIVSEADVDRAFIKLKQLFIA